MGLLQINVLGASFAIHANEKDEYLQKLLDYYKKIISEIEKTDHLKDPKQTAILAGILICDELYREKEKSAVLENQLASRMNKTDTEITRITDDLISQIEKVL